MQTKHRHFYRIPALVACLATFAACVPPGNLERNVTRLSVIGTNDVHGQLVPADERGGLTTLSGYVNALREANGEDSVLLVDAGDMWQGSFESNLSEGAVIVDIYNTMGYAAAAIGNHEFDFGPAGPNPMPRDAGDAPRGALRERALEAAFPLLTANLVHADSGAPVDWANVAPSALVDAGGVRIGIIGVMSEHALSATIAGNVNDLRVTSLADAITGEAGKLRAAGASLVIVLAHAGGRCRDVSDPLDLSSCGTDGEIFRVAEALPEGSVDHIVAGHVHDSIAHVVNGIAVTAAWSRTRAFSRVDFEIDRQSGRILSRTIFPPQALCPYAAAADGSCPWQAEDAAPATYAGVPVVPDPAVSAISADAIARAAARKQERLGTTLASEFTLEGNPESALGNLMTGAMLDAFDGEVAIHNVSGGIRATLPAGDLTFGDVYEMFPFDNRVVVLDLSGRALRDVIANQLYKGRRRAGIAGLSVEVACASGRLDIELTLADGRVLADEDSVRVIANDFLALGGDDILTPAIPADGFPLDGNLPRVRDVLIAWLSGRGVLEAEDFVNTGAPRWRIPEPLPASCDARAQPAAGADHPGEHVADAQS